MAHNVTEDQEEAEVEESGLDRGPSRGKCQVNTITVHAGSSLTEPSAFPALLLNEGTLEFADAASSVWTHPNTSWLLISYLVYVSEIGRHDHYSSI